MGTCFGANPIVKTIKIIISLPQSQHLNTCHAGYFYVLHSSPIFILLTWLHSSFKQVFSIQVKNSVDPDQMSSSEAS